MVLADPSMSLLTVCENGYGKRTAIGIGGTAVEEVLETTAVDATVDATVDDEAAAVIEDEPVDDDAGVEESDADDAEATDDAVGSASQYRRQKRGGKGVKDIKVTKRNGNAVKILAVTDQDEVLMVTASGKIQRIRAGDINEIGRNTQGVRVIRLEESDKLVSMARIPADLVVEVVSAADGEPVSSELPAPAEPTPPTEPPASPVSE